MSRSILGEALRPIAARMPRVVREHEVLRVTAAIPGKNQIKSIEATRTEILRWAQKRSGGLLPNNAWSFQDFEYLSGGRNSVAVRIANNASDVWAIRADDPDKNIAGRVWTTEVVVGAMAGQAARFSARLLVSTTEEYLDIEPHTPGFIQQIAESTGLVCEGERLTSEPWVIDSQIEAENLIENLTDPRRKLPVFVLTTSQDSQNPLLNSASLARAMVGIGKVVVLPASLTWVLTNEFGRQRSVFGGAARAYLSGFSRDANPYNHRLILADQIIKPDGATQSMRWIRSLAASESVRQTKLGGDVLAFSSIRNASLESRQQQLEKEGASEGAQLDAAKARIKALEDQIDKDKATLEYFDNEHQKAQERAEASEDQLRAASFHIQQLIEQRKAEGKDIDAQVLLPLEWAEFINWCDVHLAGRLILGPVARRSLRSPEFEDVKLAARCLLWLANICRERRMNGGDGSLREEAVEEGIRNAHCGNDQYDLDWQGQRYTADWHIKNGGNTRDPSRCLRIYYFWEPTTQQIVVADMPAHRHTGAT